MKCLSLLIALICLTPLFALGQSGIKMTSKFYEKAIFLEDHSRIKVKTIEGEKFRGVFNVLTDSTFEIKGAELALRDVSVFYLPDDRKKRRIAGYVLLGVGVPLTIAWLTHPFGVFATLNEFGAFSPYVNLFIVPYYAPQFIPLIAGLPLAVTGAVFLLKKKKHASFEWDYEMIFISDHIQD
jgi:hypothetical protein